MVNALEVALTSPRHSGGHGCLSLHVGFVLQCSGHRLCQEYMLGRTSMFEAPRHVHLYF